MIISNKIKNGIIPKYLVFFIIYNIKNRKSKDYSLKHRKKVSKFFNFIIYCLTQKSKNKIIILKIAQILYFCYYKFYIFVHMIFHKIKYMRAGIYRSRTLTLILA